jgi:hypothetical protein
VAKVGRPAALLCCSQVLSQQIEPLDQEV